MSFAPRTMSAGDQTGTPPARNTLRIAVADAARLKWAPRFASAQPYCSMASTAISWAARSSKPILGCAMRTASAKGPPPGTTTAQPAQPAMASSQFLRWGEKA